MKILSKNKQAYTDYEILSKFEAGIVLFGWEVKSVKAGLMSIDGSYIKFLENAVYLIGSRISAWKYSEKKDKEVEDRERKLLLNKREIRKLKSEIKQSGLSAIPVNVYTNIKGFVKIEVAIAKGRKNYDKRQVKRKKEMLRRQDLDRKDFNI